MRAILKSLLYGLALAIGFLLVGVVLWSISRNGRHHAYRPNSIWSMGDVGVSSLQG